MTIFRKSAVFFALCLSFQLLSSSLAIFGQAQEEAAEEKDFRLDKLWVFGGVDAGFARLQTDLTNESNKNGFHLDVKGLASYYWNPAVVDLGFGWLFNRVNGSKASVGLVYQRITTYSVFAEYAARWRMTDNWQLGFIGETVFGTDVALGATIGKKNVVSMGGVQLVYEIPVSDYLIRLVLQGMTDFTIADRQVYIAQGGFQFGLPVWKKSEATPTPTPAPTPTPTPAPIPYEEPPKMKVNLGGELVYFEFDSAKLNAKSQQLLTKIGEFLSTNPEAWERMRVDGHTDERGSFQYNLKLSKARASAVRDALMAAGVPDNKIQSEGYSFSRPLVNESNERAWAKNRRVELNFFGVTDVALIGSEIKKIKEEVYGPGAGADPAL